MADSTTCITGSTATIGPASASGQVHRVRLDGVDYAASFLAGSPNDARLSAAAAAPVLHCLECGSAFSAIDLYRDSPIKGECFACASEYLASGRPSSQERSSA